MKRIVLGLLGLTALLIVAFVGYIAISNRPAAQDEYDVAIVERAMVLLATESMWSRQDDRSCDPTATKLSLYCALKQASIEITGEFHHRRAAMQAVRRAIDRMRPNNGYEHRMQDFNNAPDVTLETVHETLQMAIRELKSEATR